MTKITYSNIDEVWGKPLTYTPPSFGDMKPNISCDDVIDHIKNCENCKKMFMPSSSSTTIQKKESFNPNLFKKIKNINDIDIIVIIIIALIILYCVEKFF